MMFGSFIHLVASKIPALQIAVLIILKGLMFGYATDETEECMPLTVALAHRLNARLAALRKDGTFPWAGPDSKTQIIQQLNINPVLIIQGPTGCGKTTQVPQYILDYHAERGKYCNIIVTQPRKIAAMSIARRVCQERKWSLGTLVGYQVAMDPKVSADTRLTYVTTGVLLEKLVAEKNMNKFTHVIIDEVHERDQDIDFALLLVKKFLTTNSQRVKFMHFIKKVGDGQVDLEQIEKEKQHDAKKISEIWSADFASAWTHVRRADFNNDPYVREFGLSISNTMMEVRGRILLPPKLQYGGLTFIILPGDESRSPKQLQMDETVPNSEPMKQITAPFLDSCGDNAVDADDSKLMHFIKKVGQVVSPFLFVLNQHAKKIPEIWSADFASAWTNERDDFLHKLTSVEDWLYGEGEEEQEAVYK